MSTATYMTYMPLIFVGLVEFVVKPPRHDEVYRTANFTNLTNVYRNLYDLYATNIRGISGIRG